MKCTQRYIRYAFNAALRVSNGNLNELERKTDRDRLNEWQRMRVKQIRMVVCGSISSQLCEHVFFFAGKWK